MYDLTRDSIFGRLIGIITENRIFLQPDKKPGFELPPTEYDSDDPIGNK